MVKIVIEYASHKTQSDPKLVYIGSDGDEALKKLNKASAKKNVRVELHNLSRPFKRKFGEVGAIKKALVAEEES